MQKNSSEEICLLLRICNKGKQCYYSFSLKLKANLHCTVPGNLANLADLPRPLSQNGPIPYIGHINIMIIYCITCYIIVILFSLVCLHIGVYFS